jgi:hypothetical protein
MTNRPSRRRRNPTRPAPRIRYSTEYGTFYRHPYYKKSHAPVDDGSFDAICGRTLWFGDYFWFESGLERRFGEQKLEDETRKTGPCGPCKTGMKKWDAIKASRPTRDPRKSPLDQAGREQARLMGAKDRVVRRTAARLVVSLLGGEIVDEEGT